MNGVPNRIEKYDLSPTVNQKYYDSSLKQYVNIDRYAVLNDIFSWNCSIGQRKH